MFATRMILSTLLLAAAAGTAVAEPVIGIRSLTNGVSLAAPPSSVPRGGILSITGVDLAAEHVAAESLPLPTTLGEPAVQVLINGTPAPLYFASPEQINAQVPWEVETGPAEVAVQHGEAVSETVTLQVAGVNVTLVNHPGTNSPIVEIAAEGEGGADPIQLGGPGAPPTAAGSVMDPRVEISPGGQVRVFAAGIGPTEPALVTGSAAEADVVYATNQAQRAFLGGVPIEEIFVEPSTELVGMYSIRFEIPETAGPAAVFRWLSGNNGASGVMGPTDAPKAVFMPAPVANEAAERILLSDLNPHLLSLNGAIDADQGCYSGVHLMDFRTMSVTPVPDCLFPSWPNAPNPNNQYRAFEAPLNSSVLAALVAPTPAPAAGLSDRLLLVDAATGTSESLAIEDGADRLQLGFGSSSTLRLERPGGTSGKAIVDLTGATVGEAASDAAALPTPLVVDDLRYLIAQNFNFPGGYRLRFLEPESIATGSGPRAVLFDPEANVVAKVAFPEGWGPLVPPRRLNANGDEIGGLSLAPVTGGYAGQTIAFLGARKSDRTGDGIVAFELALPPAPPPDAPETPETPETPAPTATLTATAIEFPAGTFAANCTNAVRWLRIPATQSIAIVGTGEPLYEFAEPRERRICAGDRIVLFDTQTQEVSVVDPGEGVRLDAWLRGSVNSYLYFGDGAREVPYKSSTKIHVYDATTSAMEEIVFPNDAAGNPVGIPYNNQQTQGLFSESKLVALATVGEPRINNAGIELQPFPGDAGLLVVDLKELTATHLPLPDGYARIEPGNFQLVQQGRRGWGLMPVIGRAVANVRRTGAPPGTGIVTWDVATGVATEIELPADAYAAVRPLGGPGANQRPYVWDFKQNSGTFAFGVYNEAREFIGVAVVGP